MNAEVITLNKKITNCNKCSRLIEFRKKILKKKENNSLTKNIGENQLQVSGILTLKCYLSAVHQPHMGLQELVEFLQEINHLSFYINVCLKLKFRIFLPPSILMMG